MKKNRTSIIIFVFLSIFVFSCQNSEKNREDELAKNDQKVENELAGDKTLCVKDYLVYFQKDGEHYDCMKKVLPAGAESLIARFTVKPLDVVWDMEKQMVYFVTQGGVFKKNYSNSSSLERVSDPLPQKENESFGEAWIDQKSGNFQISYSITSYESNPKFEKRFKELSSDSSVFIPDWGLDMIACISELKPTGKWVLVKERASRGEACDTPGLDVLRKDIKRKENTTSNQFEMLRSSYYGKVILDEMKDNRELDSIQIKKIFKNKIPFKSIDEDDPYEVHQIVLLKDKSLLIPVYWEGSPYFSSPVFVYDRRFNSKKELKELRQYENKTSHPYIGISMTHSYLIIRSLYDEEKPFIYSLETLVVLGDYPKAEEIFILVGKK